MVATLKMPEYDTLFDEWMGGFLNEDGQVELDAAVMEEKDLKVSKTA